MIKKTLVLILFLTTIITLNAQDYNLGIRAGLNYSKFSGTLEQGEENSFSGGFHFGLNFAYNFTDLFAINTGLFYVQNGNKQHFDGDSYYIFRLDDGNKLYEKGKSVIDMDVSNAYISIPLTANYFVSDKIEILGGFYANILISPVGGGTWEFDSFDNPDDISFIQSQDHNYYSDKAAEAQIIGQAIKIGIDGKDYSLPNIANAYYFFDEKEDDKYNLFDLGLTAGVNYYVNRGLYLGLRVSYGLTDTTNDKMDISLRSLDEDNNFIYTNDKDKHLGLEISLGFRF